MTREEAEALLGQFGEQLQHYTFVEDLDYALSFYRDRYDTMQAMTDMLATIGLTEDEIRRLFERTPLSAKQTFERLDEQMQTLVLRDPSTPLTKQERETVLHFGTNGSHFIGFKQKYMKSMNKDEHQFRLNNYRLFMPLS